MLGLSVAAVVFLIAAIWIGSGWRALVNPDTYRQLLTDTTLYPDLSTAVVGALANRVPTPSDPTAVTFKDVDAVLSPADQQALAAQIVEASWLDAQADKSVNLMFRWLGGDTTAMDMRYDLSDVAARLRGSSGDGLVSNILGRLPACTAAQALDLRAERQGTSTAPPPLCLPTVLQRPTIRQTLTTAVSDFASTLDTLKPSFHDTLTDLLRANGSVSPENSLVSLHLQMSLGQRLVTTGYLLALALMALLVTVGIRSARAFALWIGRISLSAALIAFLAAWLAPVIAGAWLRDSVTALIDVPALQPLAVRLAQDVQTALFGHFMRAVIGQALILGIVGLILLGGNALARRRARRQTVRPATI